MQRAGDESRDYSTVECHFQHVVKQGEIDSCRNFLQMSFEVERLKKILKHLK